MSFSNFKLSKFKLIKNFKFQISNFLVIVLFGLFSVSAVFAQSNSAQINVNVNVFSESFCNDNGICEPVLGEDASNCFNDCGCNNNGICEPARGENIDNCSNDCSSLPIFILTYTAGDGGTITGISPQTIAQGHNGSAVTAFANDGYHFTNWSDGSTSASRTDTDVQGNISLTAYFQVNSTPPPTTFTLTYTAGDGGTITGISPQTIAQGHDGSAVTALANDGYHFTNWSDGSTSASRTDRNIQGNINLSAYFSKSGAGGNGLLLTEFYIENLKIGNIMSNSAEISWQTNNSASCVISLGKTSEYETETIAEAENFTNHLSKLTGLYPSTIYHFNIICKNAGNLTAQTGDKYFTTTYIIGDVNNFTASAGKAEIFLTWENPVDPNFQLVRLVENENSYPIDINDGTEIYQGTGSSFTDKNVKVGKIYYYTIFAEGKNGSWSPGALAFAQIQPVKTPVTPVTPIIPVTPGITSNKEITITIINFSAKEANLPVEKNNIIEVPANSPITISANCSQIPGAEKLLINLQNNEKNPSSILNKESAGNSCEISIISPQNPGIYPMEISITDSKYRVIGKITAELKVVGENKSFWNMGIIISVIFVLIILILLLVFFLLTRRKRKHK